MRDVSLPGQIFSLLTVAIMISSAWIVYMQNEEDLELNRVPVWARNQMPYDTTQAYSFVLQQGEYEILETENEFNSEHVYVEYELNSLKYLLEGSMGVRLSIGFIVILKVVTLQ